MPSRFPRRLSAGNQTLRRMSARARLDLFTCKAGLLQDVTGAELFCGILMPLEVFTDIGFIHTFGIFSERRRIASAVGSPRRYRICILPMHPRNPQCQGGHEVLNPNHW